MLRRTKNTLLIGLLCFLLPGCGSRFFTDRVANPTLEDYLSRDWFAPSDVGVLSTRASHRTIIMPFKEGAKFCAEAFPPAMEAFRTTSSIDVSSVAERLVSGTTLTDNEKKSLFRELATSQAALSPPSQGVMLFTNGSYVLCQAMLNGHLGPMYVDDKGQWHHSDQTKLLWSTNFNALLEASKLVAMEEAKKGATISVSAPVTVAESLAAAFKVRVDQLNDWCEKEKEKNKDECAKLRAALFAPPK